MKKVVLHTFGVILAVVTLAGCGVTEPQPIAKSNVQNYFFPQRNSTLYRYARFNHDHLDTLACRLYVGQTLVEKNSLVIENAGAPSPILYYFGYSRDAFGGLAAVLSTDTSTLLALDGDLTKGSIWTADVQHNIQARVVDHYDQYYPHVGSDTHFSDVMVIQYHQNDQPQNVYTLRYFARDMGLIFEQLVAPNTEIASLQLIDVYTPTTGIEVRSGDHHAVLPTDRLWENEKVR